MAMSIPSTPSPSPAGLLSRVAHQSSLILAGKAVFLVVGFSGNVLLARILGPAGLGEFYLGIAIIQVASIVSLLGTDSGLIRYMPLIGDDHREQLKPLMLKTGWLVFSISTLLAIVIYVSAPWLAEHYYHSDSMRSVLRGICIFLPVIAMFRMVGACISAMKRAEVTSLHNNISVPVLFFCMLCIVALFDGGFGEVIFSRIISYFLGLLFLAWFVLRKMSPGKPCTQDGFKGLLKFCVPLTFVALSYILLGNMDVLMLGYFVSGSEVGIYSVCVRLAFFVIIGLEIFNPIVSPYFSLFSSKNEIKSLKSLFSTVTKWISISALFLLFVLFVFRLEVLKIFGDSFVVGTSLLCLIALGQFINAGCGPTGQLLVMSGRQKWEFMNTACMLILNFSLNLILIPRFGSLGAAWATCLTVILINVAKLVEVYTLIGFHPFSFGYLKGLFAVLLGVIPTFLLRMFLIYLGIENSFVLLSMGLIVFTSIFIVSLWFGALGEEDLLAFRSLFKTTQKP